jgi:hypothetical protein
MPPLRGLLLHRRVQAGQLAENRADYGTDAEFFVRVLLDIPVTPSLVNAVEQKGFVTLAGFTCLCCLPGESQATGLQCLGLATIENGLYLLNVTMPIGGIDGPAGRRRKRQRRRQVDEGEGREQCNREAKPEQARFLHTA